MINEQLFLQQFKCLIDGDLYPLSSFCNICALLNEYLNDINWVGFYFTDEKNNLYLGPFQGKTACVYIEYGKGVCGTALKEDKVLRVENVHEFKGHIACDSASNSEIVIPIHVHNKIIGVLDIDSPLLNRFSKEDEDLLIKSMKILEEHLSKY